MPLLIARQPCIGPASRPSIEIALALLLGKIKMNGSRSLNQAALSCDSPPVASSTNAAFPEPGNPEYLITSRARQPAVGAPSCLAMAAFTEADDAMAPAPNQSSPAWRPPYSQQPDASYFLHR